MHDHLATRNDRADTHDGSGEYSVEVPPGMQAMEAHPPRSTVHRCAEGAGPCCTALPVSFDLPKPNGPKAMGLVLAPLAGAPNRFVVGGPPTHSAI
jgi:hypothetical protein